MYEQASGCEPGRGLKQFSDSRPTILEQTDESIKQLKIRIAEAEELKTLLETEPKLSRALELLNRRF